jgi:hypothetical protein
VELSKQKNYQQAFDLACASLRQRTLQERAEKAEAIYQKEEGGERLLVPFFSEPYTILFPQVEFQSPLKKVVSLVTRVLVLHYLLRADGFPLSGEWVGYKDLSGGLLYAGVFARRVAEPLAKKFGRSARLFQEIGINLKGEAAGVGDASFTLSALPRIPLQFVLWEGDEEFPASVQLLFDASITHYLSLEDIVVLGQMATGRLIHRSQILPRNGHG